MVYAALAVIVIIGLALRLYRIGEESVDHEEYVSVVHLDAPGLIAFLKDTSAHYPYSVPMHTVFQYLWTRVLGTDIVRVRLLYVVTGMLCIPLLFAFTRRFFRGWAGADIAALGAAACFALSPVHVFHATEARQYPFYVLFALLSLYSFLEFRRNPSRRWLLLNLAANACVLWTHLFGALVLLVEGVFMAAWLRSRGRWVIGWATAHAVMAIPWVWWVLRIDVPADDNIHLYYHKVRLTTLLWDAFADDALFVIRLYPHPAAKAWHWVSDGLAQWIIHLRPWFGWPLVAVFTCAALWGGWRMLRAAFSQRSDEAGGTSDASWSEYALLLLWLTGPVFLLGALTNLWFPCYANRYTMFSSLALYVLMGGAWAALPRWTWRGAAALLCVMLYAYQLSLYLPGPIRTDWNSAIRLIAQEGRPDDIILVQDSFWRPEFEWNQGPSAHPVADAFHRDTLCEMAHFLFSVMDAAPAETPRRGVWVLLVDDAGFFNIGEFDACLEKHGLEHHREMYQGERWLAVYSVRSGPAWKPADVGAADVTDAIVTAATLLAAHAEHAVKALEGHTVKHIPDHLGGCYFRVGLALARHQEVFLAAAVMARSIRLNPDFFDVLHGITEAIRQNSPSFSDILGEEQP